MRILHLYLNEIDERIISLSFYELRLRYIQTFHRFIQLVPVPVQEIERLSTCMLGVLIIPLFLPCDPYLS